MAGGKVKKGFTSYLLVLLLAVVATFLIIITIMLFSPFKNILGFKYFTFKDTEIMVSNVTGGREDEHFNFETIENINVDCTYASVYVERNAKIDDNYIEFENYTTGFAREDHDTDFTYEVYYTDSTKKELNIKVHEPEGFLYFNKNVKIKILVPTSKTYSLENTALNITNTTGDIYFGAAAKVLNTVDEDWRNFITLGKVSVKTNKGEVLIRQYTNEEINSLFIKTEKGKIESRKNLTIAEKFEVYAENADLNFKSIDIAGSNSAVLNLNDSEFYTPSLKGNVELTITDGYLDIDKMQGTLSSNSAVEQMSKATITIKDFTGIISLPYANSSKVNLGTVNAGSQVYIQSTKGNIKIKEMKGDVAKLETTEGDVNVYTYGKDIDVKTTSGNITVSFASLEIADQINIVSKSGDIDFNVDSSLDFILEVYKANGDKKSNDVDIAWIESLISNPLIVNDGGNIVSLTTNGSVDVGFVY